MEEEACRAGASSLPRASLDIHGVFFWDSGFLLWQNLACIRSALQDLLKKQVTHLSSDGSVQGSEVNTGHSVIHLFPP